MTAQEFLRLPYQRVLIPDAESGGFTALIAEFPGCIAQGESIEEAYKNLEATADSWIEACRSMGQKIPEPLESNDCNGRVLARIPKSLHKQLLIAADRDGVSMNTYVTLAISEKVLRKA